MQSLSPTAPPKKLLPILIMEVLRRFTDEDHHVSQQELRHLLRQEYQMEVDRKTVHRNIVYLIEAGYPIEHSETARKAARSKEQDAAMISDLWFSHDFDDSELRLLIDGVLFSTHIPSAQRMRLVDKLEALSSRYFESHIRHISTGPDSRTADAQSQNRELFYTISVLDDAIERRRKVHFHYLEYRTDKKLHCRCREDGTVREYVVSPYQMAAKQGKYYLICNHDEHNDISNYRIDRIAHIEVLEDERVKPFDTLEGANRMGLDLQKYMTEHVYMHSSPNARCTFRVVKPMVSDVIDMFGTGVEFSDETDDHVTVKAYVNERAMQQFAKDFGPDVIVLKPKRIADKVREKMEQTLEAYAELDS